MLTSWDRDTCSLSAYTSTPGLGFATKSGVFCLRWGNQEVIPVWKPWSVSTCFLVICSENSYSFHSDLTECRIQANMFKTEQIMELLPLETELSISAEKSWDFFVEINEVKIKAWRNSCSPPLYKYPAVLMRKMSQTTGSPFWRPHCY